MVVHNSKSSIESESEQEDLRVLMGRNLNLVRDYSQRMGSYGYPNKLLGQYNKNMQTHAKYVSPEP